MVNDEQKKTNLSSEISPLANDMTYGEKVYRAVFGVGINFVVNLVTSAGFSYWVNHKTTPMKLPRLDEPARPAVGQTALKNWIGEHVLRVPESVMRVPESTEATFRKKAAESMAGVATLTAAGHFIMIPSVWLGAKIKAPMVKKINEWHYGKEAMDDPSLKARHDALEIEERPTLFGAIVGRAGTIVATQTTAWAIGHDQNLVSKGADKVGFKWGKKFKGLDAVTESIGDGIGGAIAQKFEAHNTSLNATMRQRGYGWSPSQENNFAKLADKNPALATLQYGTRATVNIDGKNHQLGGGFYEHFGRYVSADILYTAVTSLSIGPAINFLKHYIPGMTYTPKAATRMPEQQREQAEKLNVKPHTIREEADIAPNAAPTSALNTVTGIQHLDRISHAQHEAQVG